MARQEVHSRFYTRIPREHKEEARKNSVETFKEALDTNPKLIVCKCPDKLVKSVEDMLQVVDYMKNNVSAEDKQKVLRLEKHALDILSVLDIVRA